jgi:hypothetical protein
MKGKRTMYLCYVDDSGSGASGITNLTGILIREDDWTPFIESVVATRKVIEQDLNIERHREFHAVKLFKRPGHRPYTDGIKGFDQLTVPEKLQIGRNMFSILQKFPDSRIMTVYSTASDKRGSALLYGHFLRTLNEWASSVGQHVIIFYDGQQIGNSDVSSALRNAAPYQAEHRHDSSEWTAPRMVLEDPVMLDSKSNYPIQIADIAAYSAFTALHYELDNDFHQTVGSEPESTVNAIHLGIIALFDDLRSQMITGENDSPFISV